MEINLILMIRPHIVNRFMSLGENSLVAAYQGKGQLKSRPSGTRVVTITQSTVTKFLGIYMDEGLTWTQHINSTANKVAKNVGIIKRIAHLLRKKTLIDLYYTMINPFFTYGNAIWASNYPTRLASLTLLQKRAIRVITKSKHLAHAKQLFDDLSILKFDLLNEYLIGILFYKILWLLR